MGRIQAFQGHLFDHLDSAGEGIHDIQQAERLAKTFKALRSLAARPAASYADEIDSALGMAAVVGYARPFVASWSDGWADKCLKPKDLQFFDGHPQHQAEHDLVIQLRDEVVAHFDWKHRFSLEGTPDAWSESVRHLVVFDNEAASHQLSFVH